jgi:hypothetical protein
LARVGRAGSFAFFGFFDSSGDFAISPIYAAHSGDGRAGSLPRA